MRAWLIWGIGMLAYTVAVFDRSSLGVAGIIAQERFGAGATALSLFAVLQLAVYAALQVPTGLLLDRFGSRKVITLGALLLGAGQLALAFAESLPVAIGARVLVGAGDAMTFISVLRLVPLWFPSRRVPVVSQLTGILGQLGQIAAAVPLVALLNTAGWTPAYAGTAALTLMVAAVAAATLRDAPPGTVVAAPRGWAQMRGELRAAWREPGTRLGLWSHFVTPFSSQVFALLWGYPFLVAGQGLSPETAGVLLSVMVVVSIVVAPIIGGLTGQWPMRRSAMVLAVVAGTAAVWTVVLLWPGPAPLAVLILLVVVLGANGPGSMVAFDFARTMNPAERLGSANGIVNVGGWFASLLVIFAIGAVLDLLGPGTTDYSLDDFRVAFAVQYILWAVGVLGVLRVRRAIRRTMAEQGLPIPDPLPRAVLRRLSGRSATSSTGRVAAVDPGRADARVAARKR